MIDIWSGLKKILPSSPPIRLSRRAEGRHASLPAEREATARRDPSPVRLAGDRRGRARPTRPRRCAGPGERGADLRARLRKINRRQCEAAHTSSGIGELLVAPSPALTGGGRAVEGAMMRTNLWSESVPRVELDQRSRTARLRLERIDRLLIPRAAVTQSRLRRLLCLCSVGIYGGAP
jgi:hypothetical protein